MSVIVNISLDFTTTSFLFINTHASHVLDFVKVAFSWTTNLFDSSDGYKGLMIPWVYSFRGNGFPSNAKVTFFSSSNHKHSFACLRRHLSISPVNRNVNSHSSHLPSSVKIISTASSKLNLGSDMVFLLKVSFLAILTLGYIFHKLRNVELDWTCNLPGALAWKCIILKIDHMWVTIICISNIFLAFIDNLEHVFPCFDKVIVNLDNKLPAL